MLVKAGEMHLYGNVRGRNDRGETLSFLASASDVLLTATQYILCIHSITMRVREKSTAPTSLRGKENCIFMRV